MTKWKNPIRYGCVSTTKDILSEKALALVRQMGGKATTVEEALKEWPEWKKVDRIQAKQEGKFVRVTGFQFKPNQSQQQKLGEEE